MTGFILFVVLLRICLAVSSTVTCEVSGIPTCHVQHQSVDPNEPFEVSKMSGGNITNLILTVDNETTLPNFNLTVYPKILNLALFYKSLKNISYENFRDCRNLKSLMILAGWLHTIENGTFRNLANLISLRVWKSNISVVEPNAFEGLISLEKLFLHDNEISFLHPDTFGMLRSLTQLRLSNNKIKELSAGTFQNNFNLTYLSLDGNELERLPENLFALGVKITSIHFGKNKLVKARTYGAQNVHLYSNQLTSVQLDSGSQSISLDSNSIESLSCADTDLSAIKYFHASNNSLTSFDCLREMENVEYLWLPTNHFSGLTRDDFKKLTRLTSLVLFGQNQTFDVDIFKPLKRLKMLSVDGLADYQNIRTKHLPMLNSLELTSDTWNTTYKKDTENILKQQNIKLKHRLKN